MEPSCTEWTDQQNREAQAQIEGHQDSKNLNLVASFFSDSVMLLGIDKARQQDGGRLMLPGIRLVVVAILATIVIAVVSFAMVASLRMARATSANIQASLGPSAERRFDDQ